MATLIDGKLIAKKIEQKTTQLVAMIKKQGITPKLAVILVGNNPASEMYCRMKGAAAERVGMKFSLHKFPETIVALELVKKIKTIQKNKVTGLILQLPLPEHLYVPEVLNAIDNKVDVDFLTDINLGKLIMKTNNLLPPTPGAVMTILHEMKVKLPGKNVTILGTGALVGKPLAIMMMNEGASVTTCNSRTKNIKKKCLSADIIISGVGKKDLVRGDMVPKGAIVIDTGINFKNGKVYGDVKIEEVNRRASCVTPTPGGVGPVTVSLLLWNTAKCSEVL